VQLGCRDEKDQGPPRTWKGCFIFAHPMSGVPTRITLDQTYRTTKEQHPIAPESFCRGVTVSATVPAASSCSRAIAWTVEVQIWTIM